jgi:transposase-like protein
MTSETTQRVQVLDQVSTTSVAEVCRSFGISRTTYDRLAGRATAQEPPSAVVPTATPPIRSRRCRARRLPPRHRRAALGRPPG